jgi:enterochelin esterase-like enzyme
MPNRQAADKIFGRLPSLVGMGSVILIWLVACSPVTATPPAGPTPRPSLTATLAEPTLSATPTETRLPPTANPTPECTEASGQVEERSLETERMYEPFKFRVYLPPCYGLYTERNYPVLYLLHGLWFSDDQGPRLGAVDIATRLILSGEIPAFIMVMPYDPNAREPGKTLFDELFIEELVPYVDANYRSLPEARYRAVGGLSRGAGWAIHFGLSHPDLFGVIGAHSPVIFWEDSLEIGKWLSAIPRMDLPRIYMDIGAGDPNSDSAVLLEGLLRDRNIPHEWHVNPGLHDEQYWSSQVEAYLRWYASGW